MPPPNASIEVAIRPLDTRAAAALAPLVAHDGGRLVAVGGVTRDPYGDDPSVGRLRHLYVLPAARRRGIGGRLVRALESIAREWYDGVVLRTDTADAARFHAARGHAPLPPGGSAAHRRRLAPEAPDASRDRRPTTSGR